MKLNICLSIGLQLILIQSFAQDLSGIKVSVGNFVRRMYNIQAFDGVKLLQTQDGLDYMVSVVALNKDPNKSESIQSRISSIKAKAFVSQYVNGSNVSSNVTVVTTEEKTKDSIITKRSMQEVLKETSIGFAEGMELLINFDSNNGKQVVYVYYREIKK